MMRPTMGMATATIPIPELLEVSSELTRWHERVRASIAARFVLFLICTTLLFAMYLWLNWPHLGVNARLHWDAESSICTTDPMPTAAQLADDRVHIYDIVKEIHSTDPATVTAYFNSYKASAEHAPLEVVRRYYSQVEFVVGRLSFNAGKRWTGSPMVAVIFFQLTAMVAVSIAMGLLLTFAIVITPAGHDLPVRLGMLLLAFAAVASQIIFLSIARQVLTETVGILFWIPTMLMLAAAVNPRRSFWLTALLAAGVGAGVFATIRARYNMGPAVLLLMPLVLLVSVSIFELRTRWMRYALLALITAMVFGGFVVVDLRIYGPFFMPWVYDETLVKSASLYFHSDPPYALFCVMVYNNFPLLLLPVIGVTIAFSSRPVRGRDERIFFNQLTIARNYAAFALGVLGILVILMGRKAVGYQGRHLFALSAAAVLILFLTLGRVRWSNVAMSWFSALCLIVIAFNLHSTFGPQRLIPGQGNRPLVRQSFGERWAGEKNKAMLLVDLFDGYFEWADDNRLHDPLVTMQFLRVAGNGTKPLLLIAGNAERGQRAEALANQFSIAQTCWIKNSGDAIKSINDAVVHGRAVYCFTSSAKPAVLAAFHVQSTGLILDQSTLFRITGR